MEGSCLQDAVQAKKDSRLSDAISASPWARPFSTSSSINDKGEQEAWPEILAVQAALAGSDGPERTAAFQKCADKFPEWKVMVRESALPIALEKPLAIQLQKELEDNRESLNDTNSWSAGGGKLQRLLSNVRSASKIFPSNETFCLLLRELGAFSSSQEAISRLSEVVRSFAEAIAAAEAEGAQIHDSVRLSALEVLLQEGDGSVLNATTAKEAGIVSDFVRLFVSRASILWPDENIICRRIAVLLLRTVEINADVCGEELQEAWSAAFGDLRAFRDITALQDAVCTFGQLGVTADHRYRAEGALQQAKNFAAVISAVSGAELSSSRAEKVQTLLLKAQTFRAEFQAAYVSAAETPLADDLTFLKAVAGGAPGGKAWKEGVKKAGKFADLRAAVQETLARVDCDDLIVRIRTTNKASARPSKDRKSTTLHLYFLGENVTEIAHKARKSELKRGHGLYSGGGKIPRRRGQVNCQFCDYRFFLRSLTLLFFFYCNNFYYF